MVTKSYIAYLLFEYEGDPPRNMVMRWGATLHTTSPERALNALADPEHDWSLYGKRRYPFMSIETHIEFRTLNRFYALSMELYFLVEEWLL